MWGPGSLVDTGFYNAHSDRKRFEARVGEARDKPLPEKPPRSPATELQTQDQPLSLYRAATQEAQDRPLPSAPQTPGPDWETQDKPVFPGQVAHSHECVHDVLT